MTATDGAGRALSANTQRAYTGDWRAFLAWCDANGIVPLPAAPGAVARHLASLAVSLGPSSLRRRLAAIAHQHRQAGHPWERRHPAILATLRGILATHGKAARPAAVLTPDALERLLASCGTDTAGLRDRTLLLLGSAGRLRRSELVAIDREHLRFTTEGMTVLVPRPMRDGEGEVEGTTIGIPRGLDPLSCPVRAMEEWLRRTRIEWGAVFRRASPGGALEERLSPQGVWRILRRRAAMARLTVGGSKRLSPQSLRAVRLVQVSPAGPPDL